MGTHYTFQLYQVVHTLESMTVLNEKLQKLGKKLLRLGTKLLKSGAKSLQLYDKNSKLGVGKKYHSSLKAQLLKECT